MTYEQLKVLQAIVQEGTFRGAATRVHKSQPAVSSLIKNLEDELGLPLFDRAGYRPKLTSEGQGFYEQAVIALREMSRLTALSQRLTGKEEREIRLAVNQVYPLSLLMDTLRKIDTDHPATRLIVTTESVGGGMDKLNAGETDIAITTDSGLESDRMEARPFAVVRVIPVSRPDYGPATRAHNSRDDLRGDVQVIVADTSVSGPKQSLDVMPDARHWTVTDVAAKKDILMAGMGWGGLPEYLVAKELESGQLVRVHVEGFDIRMAQLYAIRRSDQPIGVVAGILWQSLGELADKTKK